MHRPRVDYDQLASAYDSRYDVGALAGIAKALAEVRSAVGARRVLEVGCGTGRWLGEVNAFTCGVDASLGMLAQARAKLPHAPLAAAQANALPFRNSSFDLIFSVNAIHHFDDPAAFIRDAAGLLTASGALSIVGIDPRNPPRRYFYDYFEGTWERDLLRYPAIGDLVNWMLAAGFRRIEYRVADRDNRTFDGEAVFSDPFLRKTSNSMLALLTDAEYERGLRRIEAAVGSGGAVFRSQLEFPIVTGWREESRT
jgi:SAM-dependent methyltransferase